MKSKPVIVTLLTFIGSLHVLNALEIILERYSFCSLDHKSPMKFISFNNTIQDNKINSWGELEFTETLFENDAIIDLQFKSCPTDTSCGRIIPIQLQGVCRYMVSKSVFGDRFGTHFTPKVRCPVKPGSYRFNLTILLKSLLKFASFKMRTMPRMNIIEILPQNRKRTVSCMEAVISAK